MTVLQHGNLNTYRQQQAGDLGDDQSGKSPLRLRLVAALKLLGIDFEFDLWMVPGWDDRPRTNSDARLFFGDSNYTHRSLGAFRDPAKISVARLRIDQGKNHHFLENFLSRVRCLTANLSDQKITDVSEVDRDVLLNFEAHVLKSDLGIGMMRLILSSAVLFFKMIDHRVDWAPRVIPQDASTPTYAKTLKDKRFPEEVVLQVMSKVGSLVRNRKQRIMDNTWTVQDDRDLLVSGALVIELSTFSRINEVLLMPLECEFEDNGYGLRMIEEKTGNPVVKPVVPEQVELIKTLIVAIKEITELSRRYAIAMERHFGPTVIFDGLPASKCLFCNQQDLDAGFGVTERCLAALEANKSVLSYKFRELIIQRPNALCKGVRTAYPKEFRESYNHKVPYPVADLCRMVLGYPMVLSYSQISFAFRENPRTGNSFSLRHGITHNGKIYIINSHQSRHYTTTMLLNGGAPMPMVDKLHGRKTPGQSETYDHPTFEEAFLRSEKSKKIPQSQLATVEDHSVTGLQHDPITIKNDMRDEVLEVIRKEMLTGTKAKIYQALCRKCKSGSISEEEFKEQEFQHFPSFTISPTGLGFCSHAWAESPCKYHYECLANDADDICEDLLPFVHQRALDKLTGIEADLQVSLGIIQKRGSTPVVEKWKDHFMVRLRNARRLKCEIFAKLPHSNTGMLDDLMGGRNE